MPLPSGIKVEIEGLVTPAAWQDVTSDVDWGTGWQYDLGRTGVQQQPGVGNGTVTLRNPLGKYTPGVQILADGTTAPYYPNITRRKRIRFSNSSGVRWLGYIKAWSPTLVNGVAGYCQVDATDRLDQLGRVTMAGNIAGEVLADFPIAYWPMDDPVGSTQAADASGVNSIPLGIANGAGTHLAFGDDGPGVEQGTGVRFHAGQCLQATANGTVPTSVTFEVWARVAVGLVPCDIAQMGNFSLSVYNDGTVYADDSSLAYGFDINVNDGLWHHYAITVTGGVLSLYVDGSFDASGSTAFGAGTLQTTVGFLPGGSTVSLDGWAANAAIYNTALSATRILAHAAIAQQSGELVSDKIKRFLTYAGLTSSDWNVDTSTVLTGAYGQDGTDVASACQDMATTEGGGSVFYVLQGVVQFRNRSARKPAASTLTIEAEQDLDNSAYHPALDDQNLINKVTVSRATESGGQSTQLAYNLASIASEGLTAGSVTSYASTDLDALNLAQDIVASGSVAGYRLPQIAVDLIHAKTNLYAAVQATVIGSRITVTNIPKGQAPATTLTVVVEGWHESANIDSYQVIYDTSPADAPPRFILDDTTYGRLQANPDCALNASLTNSATTVVIKSPTGPTFTTVGARYPLDIQVDAEVIRLNSAPGGGTTPQTFTGATRGMYGTTAAAHASNARVQLYPASGLTL